MHCTVLAVALGVKQCLTKTCTQPLSLQIFRERLAHVRPHSNVTVDDLIGVVASLALLMSGVVQHSLLDYPASARGGRGMWPAAIPKTLC